MKFKDLQGKDYFKMEFEYGEEIEVMMTETCGGKLFLLVMSQN